MHRQYKKIKVFITSLFISGDNSQIVAFFKGCLRGFSFNNERIPFALQTSNKSASHVNTPMANTTETMLQTLPPGSGLAVAPTGLTSGCQGDKVCQVNPCPNNAFCVDDWNLASCPCLPGWEGLLCDASVDDCAANLCQNGAICEDSHLSYTCICSSDRFTGRYCESLTNPCLEDPPCNSTTTASCVAINESLAQCNCQPGYAGPTCDEVIDNCLSTPCLNEGSCENAPNAFQCVCPHGYSGPVCEDKDPCVSGPCYNGGTCIWRTQLLNTTEDTDKIGDNGLDTSKSLGFSLSSSSSSSSSSSPSSLSSSQSLKITEEEEGVVAAPSILSSANSTLPFKCECPEPYYGAMCQNYNFCAGNLCRNNASCILGQNRYTCLCPTEFYGTFCEFEDHCASSPCQHKAECRNEADTYVCLCPFYFTGKNCETAINQCDFNLCFNGATCIFNATTVKAAYGSSSSSASSTAFDDSKTLSRNSEQSQSLSEESGLEETVSSASASKYPSNSTALSIRSTYCICAAGFTGDNCEIDIDECDSNPCINNGTCRDSTTRFSGENFFVGYR